MRCNNAVLEEVKLKWKNLRDRYMKKRKSEKKPTGTGAEEVEERWAYFENLSWLERYVENRL